MPCRSMLGAPTDDGLHRSTDGRAAAAGGHQAARGAEVVVRLSVSALVEAQLAQVQMRLSNDAEPDRLRIPLQSHLVEAQLADTPGLFCM